MNLKKNQKIELYIDGITAQGSGVGNIGGMAVFVGNTALGDHVICHVIKVYKNYAIAKVHKILSPSKDRIDPECPVFPQCGGCSFRHISYDAECRLKYQKVQDAFLRIAHIDITPQEIIKAGRTKFYRNKAQYPVGFDGVLKVGFYANGSHRIIDSQKCLLQPDEFTQAVEVFRKWILKYNISVYNENTHTGLLRHIYLRQAPSTGEVLACAVINGETLPFDTHLADMLKTQLPNLKGFLININKDETNVILGDRCKLLWGQPYITDILCGYKFKISPLSFYQVNTEQTEKLYLKARQYAQLSKEDIVIDLYCGTGTIGLTMARHIKRLVGIEINEHAVLDAAQNAAINGIENAEFICADASAYVSKLKDQGGCPDVVLMDPPRKGLSKDLISTIAQMQPKKVVYISCDPATLARDCHIFSTLQYKTMSVTPVDMFPRTNHVETVALLQRPTDL
ncbi:MAG: 23S rRNA (uracil(1939)-C(5))-methyltransferase RlmD [Oscillospiraceae bacterium]|nr:23S rRNA (uracil(1939)-C(5))-methyltransferase RlmD [Oscillospiraceae bacterium]